MKTAIITFIVGAILGIFGTLYFQPKPTPSIQYVTKLVKAKQTTDSLLTQNKAILSGSNERNAKANDYIKKDSALSENEKELIKTDTLSVLRSKDIRISNLHTVILIKDSCISDLQHVIKNDSIIIQKSKGYESYYFCSSDWWSRHKVLKWLFRFKCEKATD